MPGKMIDKLCADCGLVEAVLELRTRHLCRDCFSRYINSKVLKRMESYRFKNLQNDVKRRLLLPISGGISSMALLQILDTQLQKQQASRNRTAYQLIIAHVDMSLERDIAPPAWYDAAKEEFSIHDFAPIRPLADVMTMDECIIQDLSYFGISPKPSSRPDSVLALILGSAKSATAKADLQNLLMLRLLVALAKQSNCKAILWGHSDSRLAAKALAGVAKGRGSPLHGDICDGDSRWGLEFNYPVRDLFQSELATYTSLAESLNGLFVENSGSHSTTSVRFTSIDDLLSDYISSQGEKYPSIMANVVRTVSKLQPRGIEQGRVGCMACRASTDEEHGSSFSPLCYACNRIKQDISVMG